MAGIAHHDNAITAWSIHGGRLDAARRDFPDAPQPWIDLSTGINPHAYDPARGGELDWCALPDRTALSALEAAAADFFGVPADHVCAVPGSEIALRMLDALALPAPVRHLAPAYPTHVAHGAAIDIAALDDEADIGGTILLANPNNPDGRLLSAPVIATLAARMARRGGTLVIDEAFADCDAGWGVLPHLGASQREHVIVLRSFGKFFGLAGLRLGFACAPPARLEALRTRLGDWPVSAAAIAIGTAAYRDAAWIAATRSRLREEAARLDMLLGRHGLASGGACPLFRLVRAPEAHAIFERLAMRGILTRPFSYATDWLRFGLPGDEAAWDRLDRALANG